MSSKAPVDKAPAKKNSAKKNRVKKGAERGLGRGLSSLLGDRGVALATGMSGVTGASSNVTDIPKQLIQLVECHFLVYARYR